MENNVRKILMDRPLVIPRIIINNYNNNHYNYYTRENIINIINKKVL